MSWARYVSFIPAIIYFSVILILVLRYYLKKRNRHSKRTLPIKKTISTEIPKTEVSVIKPTSSEQYISDINAILAELRKSDDSRPSRIAERWGSGTKIGDGE